MYEKHPKARRGGRACRVPLMSKLRSPLRVDVGAHVASGRVSVCCGLIPRLACGTAVRPLPAHRVLRRAQVAHRSTKIGIADHSIGDRPGGATAPYRALGK